MKTLTVGTLITGMYQSPVIALLIAIALVFMADLLNRYLESKKIKCVPIDWNVYSYREIQAIAKSNGIIANKKREVLLEGLASI